MALGHSAVVVFSTNANCYYKLKPPLLWAGCPFWNSHVQVIFAYCEKTDIIIESINEVTIGIIIVFGIISKAANCYLNIRSECLAILDKLAEASCGIGILCFDSEGILLKQRRHIMHQYFVIFY
jgi:hypothetical protein